jgi:hypothetical protein
MARPSIDRPSVRWSRALPRTRSGRRIAAATLGLALAATTAGLWSGAGVAFSAKPDSPPGKKQPTTTTAAATPDGSATATTTTDAPTTTTSAPVPTTATTTTTTTTTTTAPPSSGGGSVYWGAWIDGLTYGRSGDAPWDSTTWDTFENNAGKRVSILHFGQPSMLASSFSAGPFNLTRSRGAIPLVDNWTAGYKTTDVVNGVYDASIRSWATGAKNWGNPFLLRFDHEMNGTWYSYGSEAKQNPANFVAMWRHVHDIFTSVGASNVSWVWCPNVLPASGVDIGSLYPGDAYVDWICMDGYNRSSSSSNWQTFSQVFGMTYAALQSLAPTKPIMIGETGSNEVGGSKAAWIDDMFRVLPTSFPAVKALVWFNWPVSSSEQWPIETSAGAQLSFASGIASSRYTANSYGSLATSPIPAP